MEPDEQEAQSHRWANARWIYRCKSGRLAVFDHPMRDLLGIVDTVEEAFALPRREPPPRHLSAPAAIGGLNLDELDLDL